MWTHFLTEKMFLESVRANRRYVCKTIEDLSVMPLVAKKTRKNTNVQFAKICFPDFKLKKKMMRNFFLKHNTTFFTWTFKNTFFNKKPRQPRPWDRLSINHILSLTCYKWENSGLQLFLLQTPYKHILHFMESKLTKNVLVD